MPGQVQERTISQTGTVLDHQGNTNAETSQNQTSPQRQTEVATFTCPRKFSAIEWNGDRDPIRFVPRTSQSATLSDDDASGSLEEGERTIALSANIQPVAGEEDLVEQETIAHPAVQAVNTTQGTTVALADLSVDYAADEVVVADSAVAAGDTVKVFPIITEGTINFQVENTLNQSEGTLYPWDFPLYRFHDFQQDRRGREINLPDRFAEWEENEEMIVLVDAAEKIVWTDADYPDAYVSGIEFDVQVTL